MDDSLLVDTHLSLFEEKFRGGDAVCELVRVFMGSAVVKDIASDGSVRFVLDFSDELMEAHLGRLERIEVGEFEGWRVDLRGRVFFVSLRGGVVPLVAHPQELSGFVFFHFQLFYFIKRLAIKIIRRKS